MKICKTCNNLLPETEFWINRSVKDGLRPSCKDCENAYTRTRKALHKHNNFVSSKRTENEVVYKDTEKVVFLVRGRGKSEAEAIVDAITWPSVSGVCWNLDSRGYAMACSGGANVLLHQYVLPEIEDGLVRDHINRNKLDNRMSNLRAVSQSVNCGNRESTPMRGIRKNRKTFRVCLNKDGEAHTIGMIATLEEAIQKRDELLKELWGNL